MTTPHEISLLRIAAQRLAGPRAADPAAAVGWLTALQAQDFAGALTSVALRMVSGRRAAVEHALCSGTVVKSWPMRGTLHLVPAEDLPWMLDLTTPRLLAGAAARRAALGLDEPLLERAREVAVQALTDAGELRRDDLMAAWQQAGLATTGQRGYHMLWHVAQSGTVCFGPVRDGEQRIVLVDAWIPRPRRPEREEALGEWAERYFRGHGPATVKDFARWTGLLMADVRAGVALARPRLASVAVDGVEHLLDPQTPELLAASRPEARGVLLLPSFDELLLGYQDKTATLPAEFADRIVPGGNGMFRPTVVADGRVVGTWRHVGRGRKRTLAAEPFAAFPAEVTEAVERAYTALP